LNTATIGTLSSRYAKALYAFAANNNEEEKVYDEMKYLSYELIHTPDLKKAFLNPILSFDRKKDILEISVGGDASSSIKRFFEFVYKKDKQNLLLYISAAFLSVYRKAKNIVYVKIEAATQLSNNITDKIKEHILKEYEQKTAIEMEIVINPEIIGGFIININGNQLDLSVKGELNNFRKTILKNI